MDLPEWWTALLSGQYDLVNQMIDRGANLNKPVLIHPHLRTTLLHYAVLKKRDVGFICMLANLGGNFNARDSWSRTPLHWAVLYNAHLEIVEVLINNGALVNARDHNQMMPLHYAAQINCTEVAEKLIASGASIDAINENGSTALHQAVKCYNVEMIKVLISHRANINAKDYSGDTPLLRCFKKGSREPDLEIIQLLLDNGADVNVKMYGGTLTSLLVAKYATQSFFMRWGERINEAAFNGDTALHVACRKGLLEVTALLLKFRADLNARNQDGKTPFELLPNKPHSRDTAQIIIREAVKREALGQFLCEGYKQMAQSCENYLKFDLACREEIKRMRSQKIKVKDSAISFFYILSMDEEKLSALARNEEIVTAFESSSHVASFKIYADELTTKFEVAKKRAKCHVRRYNRK